MEKQKRWHLFLILAVIAITLYNILPTLFWYSKPLKESVGREEAERVAFQSMKRVNSLEQEAVDWLHAFTSLIGVKPGEIQLEKNNPRAITVTFNSAQDAKRFEAFLPRAGAAIPFVPAQLQLKPQSLVVDGNHHTLTVERKIDIHLDPSQQGPLFTFTTKWEGDHIASFYHDLVNQRIVSIGKAIGGTSLAAQQVEALADSSKNSELNDLAVQVAQEIQNVVQTVGGDSTIAARIFAGYTQSSKSDGIKQLTARMEAAKTALNQEIQKVTVQEKEAKEKGLLVDSALLQSVSVKKSEVRSLEQAISTLNKYSKTFAGGKKPLDEEAILALLAKAPLKDSTQTLDLTGYNPYIQSLYVDWKGGSLSLRFYPDVEALFNRGGKTEADALAREGMNRLVFNAISRISRLSDETVTPDGNAFTIRLDQLTGSKSLLALNLGELAKLQGEQIIQDLKTSWAPTYGDFTKDSFPVRSFQEFVKETGNEKNLGLVVYTPAASGQPVLEGFREGSIYVIARGLDTIVQKFRDVPTGEGSQELNRDLQTLQALLQRDGFIGYSGASYGMDPQFAKDYVFELSHYYSDILNATRENYTVHGNKKYAVLEFTDVEQRILTENKIDDQKQEELLQAWEEYHAAKIDPHSLARYTVPKPQHNPYWSNLQLSFSKYFRGDERKVLKWGLDLSGGKSVRIGLRDQNNRLVENPDDLRQAANELYTRVNKMGVSEQTIRVENNTILMDFPGSQAFSASELIKASAMYFHVVNEKFGPGNGELTPIINQFLQGVWNEAIVTNRTDSENLNEIAFRHLGENEELPRSENARILYENGLRLADPRTQKKSSAFNDHLSMVTRYRGDDFTEWHGQTHPLVIVFNNYALEGASLTNVQAGFDPSEGNVLSFNVKSSYEKKGEASGSPRQDFYNWTSQFSEETIAGTPKEAYSPTGWRMAVVLNDQVINAPTLRASLSDAARISGRFTQREINQLAADLKAGSLSFTPRILSEQNVSPELGKEERVRGVLASVTSLILVIGSMIAIYRFAGVVASCAVLLNLLIMWGVLQSIGAALTLPGIAGIVLTIAMAVDANVLIFERFREEFALTGRLTTALQTAYRKAFSAIIDSNLTTLMAAFILIQFDSGPIKGCAIVLIIGILSSLFTALFATHYFFNGWLRNPEHKTLNMSRLFGETNIDFLGKAKPAIIASLLIMVVGGYLVLAGKNTIFGMDFTGGYSLTVDLTEKPGTPYRELTQEAFLEAGLATGDVQIRELSRPNQLRIQLGNSLEEQGHPFYQMPPEVAGKVLYEYEHNPRISWVLDTIAKKGLTIQEAQLVNLDKNWSVMSGQLSDTMRNNALIALSLALLSILLYITFRFEFKYAVGAVIGLVHDVVITIGLAALFHLLGFPIQIDLQAVGALMMIIGYSLNDTIIVFDRIREEVKLQKKLPFTTIINHAINVTLNRTMMTSGTTLLVLLSLLLFGGPSIFSFSLIMFFGVFVGTFSSLFIASPVMLYMHNRELTRHKEQSV